MKAVAQVAGAWAASLAFALLTGCLSTSPGTYGDFSYKINTDKTVTITRYTGSTNVVTIPGRINGLPVRSVNADAFGWDHNRLVNVTISDGVMEVEDQMFACCLSLTNVVIGTGVTEIGFCAFSHCQSLSIVTIPDSVTRIVPMAFLQCTSLTNVTIGTGVTNIGFEAFASCLDLTSVCFKGNAPVLGEEVFDGAPNVSIYYIEGTTGWGKEFGGRPTAVWKTNGVPVVEVSL